MRGRGLKKLNAYVSVIRRIYDSTPKAVFAAIAVSYAMRSNGDEKLPEDIDAIEQELLEEWTALYDNGIVPQRPL